METVARAAISAALQDSRFPRVEPGELDRLDIEISVLSVPEPILPEDIVIGLHGLLVVKGQKRGLLLPQVASERNWSAQIFLEETCVKAELPREAWRDASTRILAFTAEVFSEQTVRPENPAPVESSKNKASQPSHHS